ncbi:hypothetical protein MMPV_006343 [Pyropia vietnamensis]
MDVTDGSTVMPLVATAPAVTAVLMGGPAAALEEALAAAADLPPTDANGVGGGMPRDAALTVLDSATVAALISAPVLFAVREADVSTRGVRWGLGAGEGDWGAVDGGGLTGRGSAMAAPSPPTPPPLAAVRPRAAVVAARRVLAGAPTPLGLFRSRLRLLRVGTDGGHGRKGSRGRRVGEGAPSADVAAAPAATVPVMAATPRRPPPPPRHGAPPSGGGGRLFRARLQRALRLAEAAPVGSAAVPAAAVAPGPSSSRRTATRAVVRAESHPSPLLAVSGSCPPGGYVGGEGERGGEGGGTSGGLRRRRSVAAGTPGRPHGGRRRRLVSPPRAGGEGGPALSFMVADGDVPDRASPLPPVTPSGRSNGRAVAGSPLHGSPIAASARDSPARIVHLLGTDAAAAAAFWSPTWLRPSAAAEAVAEPDPAVPVPAAVPPTNKTRGSATSTGGTAPLAAGAVTAMAEALRGGGAATATPPTTATPAGVDVRTARTPVRQALEFG